MNDRIKEIATQAGATSTEHSWVVFTPEELEKFAELIIKECIDVIGDSNYTMLTGKAFCTDIKRHFGVE